MIKKPKEIGTPNLMRLAKVLVRLSRKRREVKLTIRAENSLDHTQAAER